MARTINEAHWRDSARPIRFFIWDGKLAFPIILPLMYARSWWTWGIALFAIIFFSILNRYGFSPIVFLRWLRTKIAGKRKLVTPVWE
ncbi:MAG: phosphoesterase [Coxiella sp. (in: Bacteria)]|nr:MAG: phosphoesterase [Coxiella sp. (in: g-proteobacteria)]